MENKTFRLKRLINAEVIVKINETRSFRGILIGVDKHLNIVLNNCQEIMLIDGNSQCQSLGLMVIRGINVQDVTAISLPPAQLQDSCKSMFHFGVGEVKQFGRSYI